VIQNATWQDGTLRTTLFEPFEILRRSNQESYRKEKEIAGSGRASANGVRVKPEFASRLGTQSGHVSNPLGSPAILGQSGSRARVPGKPPRTRHSGRFKLPLSATVFRLMRAAFDIIRG
jgi:hypothetical protein